MFGYVREHVLTVYSFSRYLTTMNCQLLMYQSALPYEAESHAVGEDREINKSTEVSPFPQVASKYSLGSPMGKREKIKVMMDPPTSAGLCE